MNKSSRYAGDNNIVFQNHGMMPSFSALPNVNRMSGLFGMGNNSNIARAAQTPNKNPLAQVNPKAQLADEQGIAQMAQKIAEFSCAHVPLFLAHDILRSTETKFKNLSYRFSKAADVSTAQGNNYSESPSKSTYIHNTPSITKQHFGNISANSNIIQSNLDRQAFNNQQPNANQTNQPNNNLPVNSLTRNIMNWNILKPGLKFGVDLKNTYYKLAFMTPGPAGLQPKPGLTANMPPQPQMPPNMMGGMQNPAQSQQPPPLPPPVSGQPMQPNQQQPPNIPQPMPPMAEPPPMPLPPNPRLGPPPPLGPHNVQMNSSINSLLRGKEVADEPIGAEASNDLQDENMMLSKQAYLKILTKYAKHDKEEEKALHLPAAHYRLLNKEVLEGKQNWLPRLFPNEHTPAKDTIADPVRNALLMSLLGGGAGALSGYGISNLTNSNPYTSSAIGAGAGALGLGLGTLLHRGNKNDEIADKMRFLPPNATVGELEKLSFDKQAMRFLKPLGRMFGMAGKAAPAVGKAAEPEVNNFMQAALGTRRIVPHATVKPGVGNALETSVTGGRYGPYRLDARNLATELNESPAKGLSSGRYSASKLNTSNPWMARRHEVLHDMVNQGISDPSVRAQLPFMGRMASSLMAGTEGGGGNWWSRFKGDLGGIANETNSFMNMHRSIPGKIGGLGQFLVNSPGYMSNMNTYAGKGLLLAPWAGAAYGSHKLGERLWGNKQGSDEFNKHLLKQSDWDVNTENGPMTVSNKALINSALGSGIAGAIPTSILGGALGTGVGMAKGNVPEGLGRGIVRGGLTGAGIGFGGLAGSLLGNKLSPDLNGIGSILGMGLGGFGGYKLGGKLLGKTHKEREEDKLEKESGFLRGMFGGIGRGVKSLFGGARSAMPAIEENASALGRSMPKPSLAKQFIPPPPIATNSAALNQSAKSFSEAAMQTRHNVPHTVIGPKGVPNRITGGRNLGEEARQTYSDFTANKLKASPTKGGVSYSLMTPPEGNQIGGASGLGSGTRGNIPNAWQNRRHEVLHDMVAQGVNNPALREQLPFMGRMASRLKANAGTGNTWWQRFQGDLGRMANETNSFMNENRTIPGKIGGLFDFWGRRAGTYSGKMNTLPGKMLMQTPRAALIGGAAIGPGYVGNVIGNKLFNKESGLNNPYQAPGVNAPFPNANITPQSVSMKPPNDPVSAVKAPPEWGVTGEAKAGPMGIETPATAKPAQNLIPQTPHMMSQPPRIQQIQRQGMANQLQERENKTNYPNINMRSGNANISNYMGGVSKPAVRIPPRPGHPLLPLGILKGGAAPFIRGMANLGANTAQNQIGEGIGNMPIGIGANKLPKSPIKRLPLPHLAAPGVAPANMPPANTAGVQLGNAINKLPFGAGQFKMPRRPGVIPQRTLMEGELPPDFEPLEVDKQGLDFYTKLSAQLFDGKFTPNRSSTGESTGLSFNHKKDDYAQGQEAWAATDKYFKGKKSKQPNPFKGDHKGIEKAAGKFGWLKSLWGGAKAAVPAAKTVAKPIAQEMEYLPKLTGQALGSYGTAAAKTAPGAARSIPWSPIAHGTMGAVGSYYAPTIWDENAGPMQRIPMAIAGALSGTNPRFMRRPSAIGAFAHPLAGAATGGGLGAMLGVPIDIGAHMAGYDTDVTNTLFRIGAAGGGLRGLGKGTFPAIATAGLGKGQLTPWRGNMLGAGKQLARVGEGLGQTSNAPLNLARRLFSKTPAKPWSSIPPATRVGLIGGTGILGGHAVNSFAGALGQKALRAAAPDMGQMLNEGLNMADERVLQRLHQLGLLNPRTGKLDLLGNVKQQLGNFVNKADPLFRGLGMRPTEMHPLHKAMLLGGGAALGGGLLAGSPAVAGLGGLSMLGGGLPYFLQAQGGSMGTGTQGTQAPVAHPLMGQPQPQNIPGVSANINYNRPYSEWELQRRLQASSPDQQESTLEGDNYPDTQVAGNYSGYRPNEMELQRRA